LDILQDTCDFLDQDSIWIFIFDKNWIRTGSAYLFDFYYEVFLRVIQDVKNDGAVVFFAMIFILYSQKIKMNFSVCVALITIDDNSCYYIVNIFRRGGSSRLTCSYIAGMLLCFAVLSGICVCCVG